MKALIIHFLFDSKALTIDPSLSAIREAACAGQ